MTPPKFFDKIAKYYDPLTHLYMMGTYEVVRQRILKLHSPDSHEILDICCGTGYICNYVLAKRVVGIDLSMEMLRVNQRNQNNGKGRARLINGNIHELPFRDERFDEVYFTLAAHEFPDLSNVLHEVWRVLKPGGQLVIYDLYEPSNPLLKLFIYTFFYYIVEQKSMVVYSREGWKNLLEQAGMRLKSLETPYFLSALVCSVK